MEVIRGFGALERRALPRVVATVGSYDGLHVAHRALVERCCNEARRRNIASMVITFEPHPRITLRRDEGLKLLTTLEEKVGLLASLGVDYLFVIDFDEAFSQLSQEEFLNEYLVEKLGVECLVMGYNHRFGRDAGGNSKNLIASRHQIDVISIEQQFVAEQKVSSTVVRRTIAEGNMALAHQQLGHPYIIIGKVGERIVRIDNPYKLLPAEGVYDAVIEDQHYSVEVVGREIVLPTAAFDNREIVISI